MVHTSADSNIGEADPHKHVQTAQSCCVQADKPPKDETEEQRMLRLQMEALAAEQKAQMQAVSVSMPLQHPSSWTSANTEAVGV